MTTSPLGTSTNGYAVMQAVIAENVIGVFCALDLIRFGVAPLYNCFVEAFDAAAVLARVLERELWNRPEHLSRKRVT